MHIFIWVLWHILYMLFVEWFLLSIFFKNSIESYITILALINIFSGKHKILWKRENSIFVLKILHQHKESKSLCTFFFGVRDLIPFNLLHKPCPTTTNLEKQRPKYTKTNQTSKVYLISCTCCILPSKWNQPWETRTQGRSHQGPSQKAIGSLFLKVDFSSQLGKITKQMVFHNRDGP